MNIQRLFEAYKKAAVMTGCIIVMNTAMAFEATLDNETVNMTVSPEKQSLTILTNTKLNASLIPYTRNTTQVISFKGISLEDELEILAFIKEIEEG